MSEPTDSDLIREVLAATAADIDAAKTERVEKAERTGRKLRPVDEQLSFSIYFAKHLSGVIARALGDEFDHALVQSGETASDSAHGQKLVDVAYSTPQGGLSIMVSLKSVHEGERDAGDARFCHNIKRNDEELRVEATALHLRQPYAVLVACVVLPFEACDDAWPQGSGGPLTSSFGRWVERLWALRGRVEPEDPPNLFELVFIMLYARDGSSLGFYEVGGSVPCPRLGRPKVLLGFDEFISRIVSVHARRNRTDFSFEGEESG